MPAIKRLRIILEVVFDVSDPAGLTMTHGQLMDQAIDPVKVIPGAKIASIRIENRREL